MFRLIQISDLPESKYLALRLIHFPIGDVLKSKITFHVYCIRKIRNDMKK